MMKTLTVILAVSFAPAALAQSDEGLCGWGEYGVIGLDKADVGGTAVAGENGGNGDVFSNVLVKVHGNCVVNGDAVSAGTVQVLGQADVTGEVVEGAAALSLQSAAAAVAAAASDNDNAQVPLTSNGKNPVSAGPKLLLGAGDALTLPAGDYYFTSTQVNGMLSAGGPVRIYLAGKASFGGQSAANSAAPQDFLLISSSTEKIKFNGGSSSVMGVYAPEAAVEIDGNATFTGAIAAKEVKMTGTSTVYYDSSMAGVCAIETACDPQTGTFTETFSTTTYRDAGATTAVWDTASGKLTLPYANNDPNCFVPAQPWTENEKGIPGAVFPMRTISTGTHLYTVFPIVGVRIFSLANPANPAPVGLIPRQTPTTFWCFFEDICADQGRLYVAGCGHVKLASGAWAPAGVMIFGLANPAAPARIGHIAVGCGAQAVEADGGRLFVGVLPCGVRAYKVLNPAAPTLLGQNPWARARRLEYRDGVLFANSDCKLVSLSAGPFPSLAVIGQVFTGLPGWNMSLDGPNAVLNGLWKGLKYVKINTPAQMSVVAQYKHGNLWAWDAATSCCPNLVYSVHAFQIDPMVVLEKTATNPVAVKWLWEPGPGFQSSAICIVGNRAYVAGMHMTLGHADLFTVRLGDFGPSYLPEGVGQSTEVSGDATDITSATLTAVANAGTSGLITYQLSNDGGATWNTVTSGAAFTFASAGNDLRWRATLTTTNDDVTPVVDQITITYTWGCAE